MHIRTNADGTVSANRLIRPSNKVRRRFLKKLRVTDNPYGCWEWQGTKNNGYGQMKINGKPQYAHRIASALDTGEVPEGIIVRHVICDNPLCCNPEHTRQGTQNDNTFDKVMAARCANQHTKNKSEPSTKQYHQMLEELYSEYTSNRC
jgi:hypothetical protein